MKKLSIILVLANGSFWLGFAIFFLVNSQPYQPHRLVFEEDSPNLIYFGRSLSYLVNEQMRPTIRVVRVVQWPSFYAASPLNFYFSRRGIVVDRTYWGVSVGGYYLIAVCLLSFLQWYLVGLLVDYFRRRLSTDRGRVASRSRSLSSSF